MKALRYVGLALLLLVCGTAAQFVWRAAPVQDQGDAWNASQAALILLLLVLVVNAYRHRAVIEVSALLAAWQIMTAGCSLAWLWYPWTVQEGDGQCSSALDLPLGATSGLLALVLAWRLYEWKTNHHGR